MTTSGETSESFGGVTSASASQAAAAAAAAVATLAAVAGKKNYCSLIVLSVGQAAATQTLTATVTGLAGGTITVPLVQGTTTGDQVVIPLDPPLPSAAVNTAVVATVPSSGVSGAAIACTLVGYVAP